MNQADLMQMLRGYQQSAIIIALVELDLCTLLAHNPQGLEIQEIVELTNLHERPLQALLEAAVVSNLLEKSSGKFFDTDISKKFLAKDGSNYLGSSVKSQADQYLSYIRLPEAVKEGSQVLPDLQNFETSGESDPALRRLIMGLHSGGKHVAALIMPYLTSYLDKANSLLDVGCGAGTFALTFAENFSKLHATLLDQPSVLKIASEIVADHSASKRISFLPANYKIAEFGENKYDIILFSQVLRTESPSTIQKLLLKAAKALTSGGVVVIYDTLLEESRTSPPENVLQNLTLALMYSEGGLFTRSELSQWLNEAGFANHTFHPVHTARPMLLTCAERKE